MSLGFSGKDLEYQGAKIENTGEPFWPDLDLAEFQKQRKLPTQLEGDTVVQAVLAAMSNINKRLADFVSDKKAQGFAHASELPGARCGEVNQHMAQYKNAVYALAKGDLLGEIVSIARVDSSSSPKGTTGDEYESATRRALLVESAQAVRGILGMGRATVEVV